MAGAVPDLRLGRAGIPDGAKLFFLGFATLFLELALIRYLAGCIWNLGYFPNLVLMAVFVGMGIGFSFHHRVAEDRSPVLFHAAAFALLALAAFVHFLRPAVPGFVPNQSTFSGELFFTSIPSQPDGGTFLPFAACGLGVVLTFALMAQRTAKLFRRFPPLTAYTLDIAGSCAGILAFMGMSWLSVPAWAWFCLVGVLFLLAAAEGGKTRWLPVVPCLAVAWIARQEDAAPLAGACRGDFEVRWSPYQKVEYVDDPAAPRLIFVNGINHQQMWTGAEIRTMFYQAVHSRRAADGPGPYGNVLVLGAGSGNDVAAALMNGAEHVDAVEIDPVIADLGRRRHPCRPYDDPRVTLVIDDGRAFMTRTPRRYDLIVFALTDSLVRVSSMAQLRLENYLFTIEAARRAQGLLNESGDLVYYNYYRRPWLRAKIERMVAAATGMAPELIYEQGDFAVIRARRTAAATGEAASLSDLPTDDWPFLYLERRSIPAVYGWAMACLAILMASLMAFLQWSTRGREGIAGGRALRVKLAFVLMGIAFLLLETKGVIQFSLLFGTTWVNNSLVFLAVLAMVLAANWAARLWRGGGGLGLLWALLAASTLAPLLYPLRNLLGLESAALRFAIASAMTFSPIFFANLLFSVTFRDQPVAEHVFGWNLLGATLGGIAEYVSMVGGYNLLAVIVAGLYTVTFALLWSAARRPDAVGVAAGTAAPEF